MICPSCGTDNPEDAGQCSDCGYKFRFGHAFNDPRNMMFPRFRRFATGRSKMIGVAVASILLLAFGLLILLWLRESM
jgi:uncharacterized membrane protein YvbJ